ncbi:MAG: hypothetical protein HYY48_09815 [Gammaproteobacteria bacterium]|nr:hypothetical protein [Gammaproteobacteria bacterium]
MNFESRFDIPVDRTEARRRFVNRVHNEIFTSFLFGLPDNLRYLASRYTMTALGEPYQSGVSLSTQVGEDFFTVLKALEAFFFALQAYYQQYFAKDIERVLKLSETDIGIQWANGHFYRTGALLLDKALVNDPLHWLRAKKLNSVLEPFEKGLNHFLSASQRPELYSDVITDMHEALEALAKIITGRDMDLSANRDSFISTIRCADQFKKILAQYIDFGCRYRHAPGESKPRSTLSEGEVESFVYLTGIFIRLAIPQKTPD